MTKSRRYSVPLAVKQVVLVELWSPCPRRRTTEAFSNEIFDDRFIYELRAGWFLEDSLYTDYYLVIILR